MIARFSVLGLFVLALCLAGCGKPTPAQPPKEPLPLQGSPKVGDGKKGDGKPSIPSATSQ